MAIELQTKPRYLDLHPGQSYPVELEDLQGRGTYARIPRPFLFGIQGVNEFSDNKRRAVEACLRQQGYRFLENNPIIVCAIENNFNTTLTIVQGHHRSRYSGKFRFDQIPSIVLTPQELAEAANNKFLKLGKDNHLDAASLTKQLLHDASTTLDSFNQVWHNMQKPVELPGVWTPYDISLKYT